MINIVGLAFELQAAEIQIGSCDTDGHVWDAQGNAIQDRADVAAVIAAHDAETWIAREQRIVSRGSAAKATARDIPSWATWTQAEWQTFFAANLSDTEADLVTSLAAARVMIKRQNTVINALAKMVMAVRDQVWPDLSE